MAKKKKHNVQIFKLEERVLFDGAAAADIVAAVNNAGNDAQADQESDDNSQDKEEKLVQNTVQNAGPVDTPAPEANVQNEGEGYAYNRQACSKCSRFKFFFKYAVSAS